MPSQSQTLLPHDTESAVCRSPIKQEIEGLMAVSRIEMMRMTTTPFWRFKALPALDAIWTQQKFR